MILETSGGRTSRQEQPAAQVPTLPALLRGLPHPPAFRAPQPGPALPLAVAALCPAVVHTALGARERRGASEARDILTRETDKCDSNSYLPSSQEGPFSKLCFVCPYFLTDKTVFAETGSLGIAVKG